MKIVHKWFQYICFTISIYELKRLGCFAEVLCDITLNMHEESCHQNSLFFIEHAGSVLQREIGVNACGRKVQRFITLLGDSVARTVWVKCLPWEINQTLFYGDVCNFTVISSFSWIWTNFMVVQSSSWPLEEACASAEASETSLVDDTGNICTK